MKVEVKPRGECRKRNGLKADREEMLKSKDSRKPKAESRNPKGSMPRVEVRRIFFLKGERRKSEQKAEET